MDRPTQVLGRIEVSVGIDCHPRYTRRLLYLGDSGDPSIPSDLADPTVRGVSDVEAATTIDRYSCRLIQLSLSGWAVVAGKPEFAGPSDSSDPSIPGDLANTIVVGVRNI